MIFALLHGFLKYLTGGRMFIEHVDAIDKGDACGHFRCYP